ncbi:MAG TPA: ATP-grasp domain-containing protein [Candidatus Gracilibacteria bacterium]|nr:ATP-grasp domain-containing protein [Candidatus Gracilibacteria bacterium]
MFLKEYEGRDLFQKYGIPVPRGMLFKSDDLQGKFLAAKCDACISVFPDVRDFVLKAQLLSGKRGKRGGVVFTGAENLFESLEKMSGMELDGEKIQEILVEERIQIAREFYLSIAIDRHERRPVILFSSSGGVDIEEAAKKDPGSVVEVMFDSVDDFDEKKVSAALVHYGVDGSTVSGLLETCEKLAFLFKNEHGVLAEINPLALTKAGTIMAMDSKIIIDDSALFLHPEQKERKLLQLSPLEREAIAFGLSYVELEGDIAIIGNGAGLVMATLDAVSRYGGKPANFCDVGGGASTEMMEKALDIVLKKKGVKTIFIDIFGGITHCDEIAEGILDYRKRAKLSVPVTLRMVGTNQEKAKKMLEAEGFKVFHTFEDGARHAAKLSS